ncbi:ATP-binding protein [Methanobrevibacter sp.]|uniref:ATP-binding protein n=1 Tax=Methanobrevibacter sp. TaxID=66852 RepID=UPI0038908AC8
MQNRLIKRKSYIEQFDEFVDTDFVKVFLGLRRSGKTSLLYNLVDELRSRGVNNENIIFISFESPEFKYVNDSDKLDKIISEKVKNTEGRVYLFFDEIQEVSDWERSINGYRVSMDCDIYITGSNSKLLSGELATYLAGRYITINVYPFSFKEFLEYQNQIEGKKLTKSTINNLYEDYFEYGGMPGILSLSSSRMKIQGLKDIYDSILLNDVISRFQIKKIGLLQRFVEYMVGNIGETFSSNSIKNYLKGNNINTTQDTLLKYNNCLQQTFFFSKCRRFDFKGKKLLTIYEKYYLMDHGFHSVLVEKSAKKIPRVLENIVYVELLRRGYNVTVGKLDEKNDQDGKPKEIDFVCEKSGKYVYIQVAYLLSSEETINREFSPFFKIPDKYDTYVITTDRYDFSQKGVKHLNIIDFLLGDEI